MCLRTSITNDDVFKQIGVRHSRKTKNILIGFVFTL